jgi:hypothetical protein
VFSYSYVKLPEGNGDFTIQHGIKPMKHFYSERRTILCGFYRYLDPMGYFIGYFMVLLWELPSGYLA